MDPIARWNSEDENHQINDEEEDEDDPPPRDDPFFAAEGLDFEEEEQNEREEEAPVIHDVARRNGENRNLQRDLDEQAEFDPEAIDYIVDTRYVINTWNRFSVEDKNNLVRLNYFIGIIREWFRTIGKNRALDAFTKLNLNPLAYFRALDKEEYYKTVVKRELLKYSESLEDMKMHLHTIPLPADEWGYHRSRVVANVVIFNAFYHYIHLLAENVRNIACDPMKNRTFVRSEDFAEVVRTLDNDLALRAIQGAQMKPAGVAVMRFARFMQDRGYVLIDGCLHKFVKGTQRHAAVYVLHYPDDRDASSARLISTEEFIGNVIRKLPDVNDLNICSGAPTIAKNIKKYLKDGGSSSGVFHSAIMRWDYFAFKNGMVRICETKKRARAGEYKPGSAFISYEDMVEAIVAPRYIDKEFDPDLLRMPLGFLRYRENTKRDFREVKITIAPIGRSEVPTEKIHYHLDMHQNEEPLEFWTRFLSHFEFDPMFENDGQYVETGAEEEYGRMGRLFGNQFHNILQWMHRKDTYIMANFYNQYFTVRDAYNHLMKGEEAYQIEIEVRRLSQSIDRYVHIIDTAETVEERENARALRKTCVTAIKELTTKFDVCMNSEFCDPFFLDDKDGVPGNRGRNCVMAHMSVIMSVMATQFYSDQQMFLLLALLGRMLHPARTMDNFQVFLMLCGLSRTGKGVILDLLIDVFSHFYVTSIQNDNPDLFASASLGFKRALYFPDLRSLSKNFSLEKLLRAAANEAESHRRMYQEPIDVTWRQKIAMATNLKPREIFRAGGGDEENRAKPAENRAAIFRHAYEIPDALFSQDLGTLRQEQVCANFAAIIRCNAILIRMLGSKTLTAHLPLPCRAEVHKMEAEGVFAKFLADTEYFMFAPQHEESFARFRAHFELFCELDAEGRQLHVDKRNEYMDLTRPENVAALKKQNFIYDADRDVIRNMCIRRVARHE